MKKKIGFGIVFGVYLLLIALIALLEQSDPNANIKTLADAFWYAIVTLTTVGYGDFYPVTISGKILGLFVIVGSIGVIGYFIGEISSRINMYMEKKKQGFFGTDFENHYVIIGWSDFARKVAEQVFPAGHKLAFVTNSKTELELIQDLYPQKQAFVMFSDYNNMEAYSKVNIEKAKAVYLNFSEDTDTLVFVLNIKKLYPNINIIVNCNQPDLKTPLIRSGVNHVVSQSEVVSRMVASYLFEPHVAEYTEDLISTSVEKDDQDVQQFLVTEKNPYKGMEYFDAFVKMKKDINAILIGLVINNKIIKDPADKQLIEQGQYLIIISSGEKRKQIEEMFDVKEGL